MNPLPPNIARLDAISRTRALTPGESAQLESHFRHGRGTTKTGAPNRLIGQGESGPLPSNRSIEASDRVRRRDAEEQNKAFMAALERYFKRGGRA